MGLLDLALEQTTVTYVDTTTSPSAQDLINLNLANSDTVVYYGDGSLDVTSLLEANAISSIYTVVTGGTDLVFDGRLLDVSALASNTLVIDGDSSITIETEHVSVASAVTSLFKKTKIAFSGSGNGTFTYIRPDLGVASSVTITITEMSPGDKVVISVGGTGVKAANTLRELGYDTEEEYLTLVNGSDLNSVYVKIKMTEAEYKDYAGNNSAYLNADGENTFAFPGDDRAGDDDDSYVIPCFTAGTLIKTQRGEVPVENLTVGDFVLSLDHGYLPIVWIGSRQIHEIDLARDPNLRPIRIQFGALGESQPEQNLLVSPQHRVLVRSVVAERMFGSHEVLVAAKHLVGIPGIEIEQEIKEVSYWHFMFQTHELIFSDGAVTESMYAGSQALNSISADAREELLTLFPELCPENSVLPQPVRQLITGRRGRQFSARLTQNNKPPIEVA